MIFNIIVAIIAVPIVTASFALAILWYARSSTSVDSKARHQAWLVEILLSLGVFTLSAVTTRPSNRTLRVYLLVFSVIAAIWVYRDAKFLVNKRKHV